MSDGYPARNVTGCDLSKTFLDIGFDRLFEDRGTCAITLFPADIFDVAIGRPTPSASSVGLQDVRALEQLNGRLTHVYAGLLFHLFDEETQYAIALRIALLLKIPSSDEPLAMPLIVFGRHQGKEVPGNLDDASFGYVCTTYILPRPL